MSIKFRQVLFSIIFVLSVWSLNTTTLCLAQTEDAREEFPLDSVAHREQPRTADKAIEGEVKLRSGDAIRLLVYDGVLPTEKSKFISNFHDQEFPIDGNGEIRLYSLGKLKVAGLTADQISQKLVEEFKPFAKNPIVVVIPLVRVTLRGEWGKPGMYRFSLDTSFWDMVKEAGGLSGFSTIESMYLVRKDEIVYKDFVNALYNATSLYELGVESGDEIVAPRVNRLTLYSISRYFQFAMSILIFYFTVKNYSINR